MGEYAFVGSCCETGIIGGGYFEDATDLAQAIENSRKVSRKEFMEALSPWGKRYYNKFPCSEFGYNDFWDLYWAYNPKEDIHFFYGKTFEI